MKQILLPVVLIALSLPLGLFSVGLHTSDYNYYNDIVGDRATGMGGAYTAISDDPSGAWYNPAGLVFSMDNQISLSVNSYQDKGLTIERAFEFGGRMHPYKQNISTFYPSFFGVVQSLGDVKFAFTVTTVNNEFLDQDTFHTAPDGSTFNMKYNLTDSTAHFGASAAVFLSDTVSVGITLSLVKRRNEQINTYITSGEISTNNTALYIARMLYTTDDVWGGTARLGVQWMPTKTFTVGASALVGTIFSHTQDAMQFVRDAGGGSNFLDSTNVTYHNENNTSLDSALPVNLRVGVAWFASKDFLLSADIIADIGIQYFANVGLKSTLNAAIGMEYYLAPSIPFRFGLFSNMANTPEVVAGKYNQELHANLLGIGTSIGWQTRNSSIALSFTWQGGKGKIQVSNEFPEAIQDVSIRKIAFSLTGSARY